MSVENVVKFYELVASDEGLQDRMQAATDPEAFMAKAVEIGGEQGLEFTGEELRGNIEKLGRQVDEELSESDLEEVAGGGWRDWTNTYSGCANCVDSSSSTIERSSGGKISTVSTLSGGGTTSFNWTNTYSGCANC